MLLLNNESFKPTMNEGTSKKNPRCSFESTCTCILAKHRVDNVDEQGWDCQRGRVFVIERESKQCHSCSTSTFLTKKRWARLLCIRLVRSMQKRKREQSSGFQDHFQRLHIDESKRVQERFVIASVGSPFPILLNHMPRDVESAIVF